MSQTVAEELVDTLVKAGVQRIYGIVGDSLNPVTDAIRRSGKIQLGACPPRRNGGVRGRGGGPAHRPAGGLRGQLRPRQPAPDQRAVRRPPEHGPRAGHRRSHPQLRDRHRLLPGDAPRPAVPRVQPLLRTHLQSPPDAARAANRHAARGEQAGRFRDRVVGRRRGHGRRRRMPCARARHRAAGGAARGRRPGPPGRPPEQGAAGDAFLRQRLCRRARRGRGPGREAQGAGRLRLPRQGMGRVRQPLRRRA